MREAGVLDLVTRGLCRLASIERLEPRRLPGLIAVAWRAPEYVNRRVPALPFYELTTHAPKAMDVALERRTRRPRLVPPSTRTCWFSGPPIRASIDTHGLGSAALRIRGPEKTIADGDRERNQIGAELTRLIRPGSPA
ncbi:MAG: hypothetical protein JNM84_01810 [Planctomycetes bacterium]|nr:hypothetical protein [Planctomycetota bacterium]